jgi:hypothetical protein
MRCIHKNIAEKWSKMSFAEQMANIGSEVERSLNWKAKGNEIYFQAAFERFLDLIDLTLDNTAGYSRLKELARLREAVVDYFYGTNQFQYTPQALRKYFFYFTFLSRRSH